MSSCKHLTDKPGALYTQQADVSRIGAYTNAWITRTNPSVAPPSWKIDSPKR